MDKFGLIRRGFILGIGAVLVLAGLLTVAPAAPNILEKGTFQAVESNGAVVIIKGEHTGLYQLSGMAQVYDGFGKKTTIDTYMVPSEVEFLVEYTEKGPVIKKIREIPQ